MYPVLSAEEMRAMDEITIRQIGVPDAVLMELAGRGCLNLLEDTYGPLAGANIVVVAGKGNNGGDGFVIARCALLEGAKVKVLLLGQKSKLKGSPRVYEKVLEALEVEVEEIPGEDPGAEEDILLADVVVDAIFGTGFKGAPKGVYEWAIETINESEGFVLSVDIPSGVEANTGKVRGAAVAADLTVTMAYPKIGHYIYPGAFFTGTLRAVDIGIPPHLAMLSQRWCLEPGDIAALIPTREGPENKSHFGKLLIVAGSWQYSGAALLAARGAIKSGVGVCYLGVPESLKPHLMGHVPGAILVGLPEEDGAVAPGVPGVIRSMGIKPDALVLGPGLTRTEATREASLEILREFDIPGVVDADGIWCVAGELDDILASRQAPLILTPHPGEMSLLTGEKPHTIDQDRLEVAEGFVEGTEGLILLLKGSPTIVTSGPTPTFLNLTGNPGMATGGSGDVLAGVIGSLLAQKLGALEAAGVGAYIHGLAGDLAAEDLSLPGLTPSDIADYLPRALRQMTQNHEPDSGSPGP